MNKMFEKGNSEKENKMFEKKNQMFENKNQLFKKKSNILIYLINQTFGMF